MKPAHVPGTSLGSLYDMQIRVPNISGQETSKWGLINATFSGALYPVKSSANHIGEGGGNSVYVFGIDASRSSSLYGKSATAQPESLRLLPCIKF